MSKRPVCPYSGRGVAPTQERPILKTTNSCQHHKCFCGKVVPLDAGSRYYRHRVGLNG